EQLRGAPQTAERIFDFMGQLPDHQPAAAQLGQQGIFSRQAPMLRDVLDFQQQVWGIIDGDLGDGTVEYAVDSAGCGPGQFALNDALAAAQPGTFAEIEEAFCAARKIDEAPAERLIGPQAQQGLAGGIQVDDVQVLIE